MSQIRVSEQVTGPLQAKEVRLQCPHCHGMVFVPLPWNPTAAQRLNLITEAITEHRKLCAAAPPEAARAYRIDYPRK